MNKDEFFNRIKEVETQYYKTSPCYQCHSGNGCDDCRGCKDGYVDQEMRININKMKEEFKLKFGINYNAEVEERQKKHHEQTRKQVTLKDVWKTCTFDEIIDAGFEYNKCSGEQLINAAAEFEVGTYAKEEHFVDALKKLFNEYNKSDLPWTDDIMDVIKEYYHESSLMSCFDNDDLIAHLDGTIEMDNYIEEHTDYIDEPEVYTFNDFVKDVDNLPNYKLKNFLCDLVMANHHISNDELMNKLKERI